MFTQPRWPDVRLSPHCMNSATRSFRWRRAVLALLRMTAAPPTLSRYTSGTSQGRRRLMTPKNPWNEFNVSRRDMLRLGAGGIGLGLFGGIGRVPPVLSQASSSVAANQSGKILVVFE